MKPIKITRTVRDTLKDQYDINTNYDGLVNRLIHEVADEMPIIDEDKSVVNISLHEDTMDKLKSYRLSRGESYENIIIRMLLIAESLNSSSE